MPHTGTMMASPWFGGTIRTTKSPGTSIPSSPRQGSSATTSPRTLTPTAAATQLQPVVKVVINIQQSAEEEANAKVASADLAARSAQYERDLLAHQLKLLTQERSQLRSQLKELATQQLQLHRAAMGSEREAAALRQQAAEAATAAAAAQAHATQLQAQLQLLMQQQARAAAQQPQPEPGARRAMTAAGAVGREAAGAAAAAEHGEDLGSRKPSFASLASHSHVPDAESSDQADLVDLAAGLFDDVSPSSCVPPAAVAAGALAPGPSAASTAELHSFAQPDQPSVHASTGAAAAPGRLLADSPFAHFRPEGLVQLLPPVIPEGQESIASAASQQSGPRGGKEDVPAASELPAAVSAASENASKDAAVQNTTDGPPAAPDAGTAAEQSSDAAEKVAPAAEGKHVTMLEGPHDAADPDHPHLAHRFSLPPISVAKLGPAGEQEPLHYLHHAATAAGPGLVHPPSPKHHKSIPIKQQLVGLSTCSQPPSAYASLPPSPGPSFEHGLVGVASWGANRGWMQASLPHLQAGLQAAQLQMQHSSGYTTPLQQLGGTRAAASRTLSRSSSRAGAVTAEAGATPADSPPNAAPALSGVTAGDATPPAQGPISRLLAATPSTAPAGAMAGGPSRRTSTGGAGMLPGTLSHMGSGAWRTPAGSIPSTPARSPLPIAGAGLQSVSPRGSLVGGMSNTPPLLSPRRTTPSAGTTLGGFGDPAGQAALLHSASFGALGPSSAHVSPTHPGVYRSNTLPAHVMAPEIPDLPPGPSLIKTRSRTGHSSSALNAALKAAGQGQMITMGAPVAAGTARIHTPGGGLAPGQTLTGLGQHPEAMAAGIGRLGPALTSVDGGWGVWQQGVAGVSGAETPHSHAVYSDAATPRGYPASALRMSNPAAPGAADLHPPLSPTMSHHVHWAPSTLPGTAGIRSGLMTPGGGGGGGVPLAFGHTRLDENLHLLQALEAITRERRAEIDAELEQVVGDDDAESVLTDPHGPTEAASRQEGVSKVVEALEEQLEAERREAALKEEMSRVRGHAERTAHECGTLRQKAEHLEEQYSEALRAKCQLEAELAALRNRLGSTAGPAGGAGGSSPDAAVAGLGAVQGGRAGEQGGAAGSDAAGGPAAGGAGDAGMHHAPSLGLDQGEHIFDAAASGAAASGGAGDVSAAAQEQQAGGGCDAAADMQERCRDLLEDILGAPSAASDAATAGSMPDAAEAAARLQGLRSDSAVSTHGSEGPWSPFYGDLASRDASFSSHSFSSINRPVTSVTNQQGAEVTPPTHQPNLSTPNAPRRSLSGAPPHTATPTVSKAPAIAFSFSPVSPQHPVTQLAAYSPTSGGPGEGEGSTGSVVHANTGGAGSMGSVSSEGAASTLTATPPSAVAGAIAGVDRSEVGSRELFTGSPTRTTPAATGVSGASDGGVGGAGAGSKDAAAAGGGQAEAGIDQAMDEQPVG